MSKTTTTTMRFDQKTKDEAYKIFKELGITPSQGFNMFLKQVVHQKGIPFELKVPNQKTIAALDEDYSKLKTYNSVNEALDDLDF